MKKAIKAIYWRKLSDTIFERPVRELARLNIHPCLITTASLASNLLLVYFLFDNHLLFVLFIILHFLLDNLDGALARLSRKESSFGRFFDKFSDHFPEILLYLKAWWRFKTNLVLVVLAFFIIHLFLAGRGWKTVFGPHTTFIRILFVFKLYYLGIIIQLIYYPIALLGGHLFSKAKQKSRGL